MKYLQSFDLEQSHSTDEKTGAQEGEREDSPTVRQTLLWPTASVEVNLPHRTLVSIFKTKNPTTFISQSSSRISKVGGDPESLVLLVLAGRSQEIILPLSLAI